MRSMTGYAQLRRESPDATIEIELRSLNGRFLKITSQFSGLPIEKEEAVLGVLRRRMRRGSVHVGLAYTPTGLEAPFRVKRGALRALVADVAAAMDEIGRPFKIDPASLLAHEWLLEPATVDPARLERDWPGILEALDAAVESLDAMRRAEGAHLAVELAARGESIRRHVRGIRDRLGPHLADFRARLRQRLETLLAGESVPLREDDLARELAFYADRSDISEELGRLESHLSQYSELLDAEDEVGRKLEFVVQEILRETNTVGAKTLDPESSRAVIEVKSEIERIKEQIQNVE